MDVRNCKMCGNLFNYTGSPLCPACNNKMEKKFSEVKDYICLLYTSDAADE